MIFPGARKRTLRNVVAPDVFARKHHRLLAVIVVYSENRAAFRISEKNYLLINIDGGIS
jgi:hypothetical protein